MMLDVVDDVLKFTAGDGESGAAQVRGKMFDRWTPPGTAFPASLKMAL